MAAFVGRSPDARTVAGVVTTSASAAITAPAGSFDKPGDVGRTISGTGIPGGATIAAVASSSAATLSANATASGTVTASVGTASPGTYGFSGWSPQTDTEAGAYTIAGMAASIVGDRITDTVSRAQQRSRG